MIKRVLSAIVLSVALMAATTAPAFAAPIPPDPGSANAEPACNASTGGAITFLELKPWDACLIHDANGVPQIASLDDIWRVAVVVLETMIKIVGYLAVGFIIWGGIKYLKSQGEPSETADARKVITNALAGLIISVLSVAIIQFIAGTF